MTFALGFSLVLLAAKHVQAVALPPTNPTNPRCVDLTIPVTVTGTNAIYDLGRIDSNIEATDVVLEIVAPSQRNVSLAPLRNITITDTFDIAAFLCTPKHGAKKEMLQIATHGGGFDHRYWDVRVDPKQYSYVDNALDAGYSILTYDRLGTGKSPKPDAYKVVQLPLQVEILREITEVARKGELMKYANSSDLSLPQEFEKIIHVSHSLGSSITSALLTHYGGLSDAAIITGFIIPATPSQQPPPVTAFEFEYAFENDPVLFKDHGSGYIVPGTKSGLQTTFFSDLRNKTAGVGGFEPRLLDFGFAGRQPSTAAEILSTSQLGIGPSAGFKGPIQFMEAEFDFLICGGDCRGLYDEDFYDALYPHASAMEMHIQEGTGHGMTYHKGANVGYKASFDFLAKNGF